MSKWAWLSPMFEGLDRHADEMRGFQSTVMSQMLHLCIPDSASQSQAHALHRLRRRFSRLLLANTQWMSSAMARRWSYFGHVLRQHSQHITMLGLSSLTAQFCSPPPGTLEHTFYLATIHGCSCGFLYFRAQAHFS